MSRAALEASIAVLSARLAALNRPVMPALPTPAALANWKERLHDWREGFPKGEAVYAALWGERDGLEFELHRLINQARQKQSSADLLKASGAGARAIEAAARPTDTKTLEYARTWFNSSSAWLVLGGSVGAGKTVAATWCLTRTIERGIRARNLPAVEFARISSFGDGSDDLDDLRMVPLLVVDDLGKERLSDYAAALFFEVFDSRHQARKRTVITTNLTSSDFRSRYLALADRISEDGRMLWVAGDSLRKGAA